MSQVIVCNLKLFERPDDIWAKVCDMF